MSRTARSGLFRHGTAPLAATLALSLGLVVGLRFASVAPHPADWISLGLLLLVGGSACAVCWHMRRLLRQAEVRIQRLEDTLTSMRDGVVTVDTAGRVTFLNPAAQALTGWRQHEALGQPFEEVVRVVDEPLWRPFQPPSDTVLQADTAPEPTNAPVLLGRHGAAVAVEERGWPLRTRQGNTAGAVLLFREVSRRREAEAALCEREEKFRFLAEMLPAMVWTARPDGSNDYASRRWYDYSGLTPKESQGWGWKATVHPEDLPHTLALWEQARRTGAPGEVEVRLRRKDGAYRWFLLRAAPMLDELGVCTWFGTSTDIDDRKRAEQALRESEERFRRIVETAAEGVWVIDAESKTTYVNRRMAEILGCDVEDLLDHYPNDFLYPEDLEEARRLFRSKRQGDRRAFDFRLRRKDGTLVWVSVANNPMYDDGGQFLGVLGMFSDITDRKRMEEELRQADRRKDEALAVLAHEMGNTLSPICNALGALRLTGGRGPHAEEAIGLLERQTGQLVRLVGDIVDISSVKQGKVRLRKEPIELAPVLAQAVETSRPVIDARGHKLVVSLSADPVRLEADPGRLAQVFANLLSNAAKYTPEGGHIWLTAEQAGGEAVVRVRDDGVGIAPELLPHVFDLFMQVDESRERSQGGLGIGLALVKSLVELHCGTVAVSSDGPGRGSTFEVRLPT